MYNDTAVKRLISKKGVTGAMEFIESSNLPKKEKSDLLERFFYSNNSNRIPSLAC